MIPNTELGPHFWNSIILRNDFRVLSTVGPSGVVNKVWARQPGNTHRWSLYAALDLWVRCDSIH